MASTDEQAHIVKDGAEGAYGVGSVEECEGR